MTLGYIGRRLGLFCFIAVAAFSLNFVIPHVLPGDPIRERFTTLQGYGGQFKADVDELIAIYDKKFGFDQPIWKQYLRYWGDVLRGDLGQSASHFPAEVTTLLRITLPWSIGLLVTATAISFAIGTLLGALLAWPALPKTFRGSLTSTVPLMMVAASIPSFLIGIVLVFFFVIIWNFFPPGRGIAVGVEVGFNWTSIISMIDHAFLPAMSMVLATAGLYALTMRGMMVTVMGEDYITLAKAKGLKGARIFLWYALRTALLPQATALALSIGHVVTGSILVETVFAYPGVGNLLFESIRTNDFFMIQGIAVILILATAVSLLFMDLLYPLIDPRIRAGQT